MTLMLAIKPAGARGADYRYDVCVASAEQHRNMNAFAGANRASQGDTRIRMKRNEG